MVLHKGDRVMLSEEGKQLFRKDKRERSGTVEAEPAYSTQARIKWDGTKYGEDINTAFLIKIEGAQS